jgi:hypothetical protein
MALDDGVHVTGMGQRFVFVDQVWRSFEGKYVFSGGLVLISKPTGNSVELNARLFRSLCGSILTAIVKMPEAPTERRNVFRLTFSFPVFEDGEATGEIYGDQVHIIPVENGACPSAEDLEKTSFYTFPGVLHDWGLKGIFEYTSTLPEPPDLAAVFAPRTGRMVPPLPFVEACQAAVFDAADVIQDTAEHPERLAVLFLGTMAKDMQSPVGERGLAQNFLIADGMCNAVSEIYPVNGKNEPKG